MIKLFRSNIIRKAILLLATLLALQAVNSGIVITVSEATSEVSVVLPEQRVNMGDSFNFSVHVSPNTQPLSAAQLNLKYNTSIIKINYIYEGDFFSLPGAGTNTYFNSGRIDNSIGYVINAWDLVLGSYNVSAPGTFIIVNATAIGTGSTYINLSNAILVTPDSRAASLSTINQSMVVPKSYDINGDQIIDLFDIQIIDQHFGESTSYPYPTYDVNKDGVVNIFDAWAVAKHFGERY